jgi:hypothetical protein
MKSSREKREQIKIEGKLAALDGKMPSNCPYIGVDAWTWRKGFEEGIEEINAPSKDEMRVFLALRGWQTYGLHGREVWISPEKPGSLFLLADAYFGVMEKEYGTH